MANELILTGEATGSIVKAVLHRDTDEWVWDRLHDNGVGTAPGRWEEMIVAEFDNYGIPLFETPAGSRYWVGDLPANLGTRVVNVHYMRQAGVTLVPGDVSLGIETLDSGQPVTTRSSPASTYYVTYQDMRDVWGDPLLSELSKLTNATQPVAPSETRIMLAVSHAEAWLHSHLYPRFLVPLVNLTSPDLMRVRDWVEKMALHWLYEHRPGAYRNAAGQPMNPARAFEQQVKLEVSRVLNGSPFSAAMRTAKPVGAAMGYVRGDEGSLQQ